MTQSDLEDKQGISFLGEVTLITKYILILHYANASVCSNAEEMRIG